MKCSKCGFEIQNSNATFCPSCGDRITAKPELDLSAIWPDWKVEKKIGKGSYGTVYQAIRKDSGIESRAAIKVISVPSDQSEIDSLRFDGMTHDESRTYFKNMVKEFVAEISLMQNFKGVQNIVSVEDYKVVEKKDEIGWDIYIRMELLTPLDKYLCDKVLDEKEVVKLGTDICYALEMCNRYNVIHRDIKPENIFVNKFGHFKLGDFGIARSLENRSAGMSQKGTPNYMAPEVVHFTDYDSRVDIYSLGIMLYRFLNDNRLPFVETEKQILSYNERKAALDRRLKGELLPPPSGATPALAEVILKACSFNPNGRYSTAKEFSKALTDALNAKPAPPPPPPLPPQPPSPPLPPSGDDDKDKDENKNKKGNKSKNNDNDKSSKKFIALISGTIVVIIGLIIAIIFVLGSGDGQVIYDSEVPAAVSYQDMKIGLICKGSSDVNYDRTFIDALRKVQQENGMSDYQIVIRENISEGEDCAIVISELVGEGCTMIIGTSTDYEEDIINAATYFSDVRFTCIGGKKAHTLDMKNYSNAYGSVHEVRYITGVAAGLYLNQMMNYGQIYEDEAVIGFVGTFTKAEVISAYTAFYLGAKSVCPSVSMLVEFTGNENNADSERNAAKNLISKGAVLISQFSDTGGAVAYADSQEIGSVAFNLDSHTTTPQYCVASSMVNWDVYFSYALDCMKSGKEEEDDWAEGIEKSGSGVKYAVDYDMLPYGAKEEIDEAVNGILYDSLNIFDTSSFIYNGSTLRSYYADVDPDPHFEGDTEVISGGNFRESFYRSAPYFDILIDEITLVNEKY